MDKFKTKIKNIMSDKHKYRYLIPDFVKKGVICSLIVSLMIFGIYLFGSIPDPGFTDNALFMLLRLLYYSSLLLMAFSLFALGLRIHLLVYNPSLRAVFGLFTYFFTGVLGAFFVMLNSLIVTFAAGN